MSVFMSCSGQGDCTCGCCAGIGVQTPQAESNLPGLSSVGYRAGTWATFKESMLARLSSSDYPALSLLKTRDDDDFTIAFLDATAVVLDILTFYQERLANESYLGTAGQLRSLTELSRLIGYQPSPGVSASTYLAFTLKSALGLTPDPSTPAITIPAGTQVQSVPAQGQTPQTFETSAAMQAKADWNALPVQTGRPWAPPGGNSMYLSGTSTQLQIGDSLLILGVDREEYTPPRFIFREAQEFVAIERARAASAVDEGVTFANPAPSDQWEVVVLNQVQVDSVRRLTFVSWDQPLSHESGTQTSGSWAAAKVFAFRQKAALFGHNAPDPNLFVNNNAENPPQPSFPSWVINSSVTPWQWSQDNFQIPASDQIDLDAAYPKIVVGSWFALTTNGTAQLYKATKAVEVSVAKFALSGKVTELTSDYVDVTVGSAFPLRQTEVWAQSDQLEVAQQRLTYPLYGTLLDLEDLRPDLVGAEVVALSGNSQKITVGDGITNLVFIPDDENQPSLTLNPGDVLTLTDPTPLPLNLDGSIPDWSSSTSPITLSVEDANGRTGAVLASLSQFTLALSGQNDPEVSEYALVSSVGSVTTPYPHTQIQLQSALINCYDRASTTVNANVGLATQGQSVTEIMGSASASTPDQSFTLKQSPLTYVQAPTPTGGQSTLQVQANGVAWTEVPSLYDHGPSQQVFATLNQSDGTTDVLFGDGVEGALLPTGQNNIQANYRTGLGSAGNVAADTLTTLIDRPLGVSGVTNPEPATGGQDPQSVDDIRANAPQTVQTLGRAASLADYQNFAATFAGIAKAYAIWIPSGPGRGVFLTVAGVNGAALPPGNPTLTNLVTALQDYGNPLIPINVVTFLETLFGLTAYLKYDSAYNQPAVETQVLQTLSATFGFANRTFGQGVSADEVAAVIQAVPGVVAVNVTAITPGATSAAGDLASEGASFSLSRYKEWLMQSRTVTRPLSGSPTSVYPYVPVATPQGLPQAAEILVLDPDPNSSVLGVMP